VWEITENFALQKIPLNRVLSETALSYFHSTTFAKNLLSTTTWVRNYLDCSTGKTRLYHGLFGWYHVVIWYGPLKCQYPITSQCHNLEDHDMNLLCLENLESQKTRIIILLI